MKLRRNAENVLATRPVSRLLGIIVLATAGLIAPTCYEYEHPGVYYCDETNNCADLPPLVCHSDINECLCPNVEDWYCLKVRKCMPVDECFPEASAPCDDGGGGAGGGDDSGGGAGGG